MTRSEFQELLDEEEVVVAGIRFGSGWLLRKADPVAFDVMYWTYVHSVEEEEEGVY